MYEISGYLLEPIVQTMSVLAIVLDMKFQKDTVVEGDLTEEK